MFLPVMDHTAVGEAMAATEAMEAAGAAAVTEAMEAAAATEVTAATAATVALQPIMDHRVYTDPMQTTELSVVLDTRSPILRTAWRRRMRIMPLSRTRTQQH